MNESDRPTARKPTTHRPEILKTLRKTTKTRNVLTVTTTRCHMTTEPPTTSSPDGPCPTPKPNDQPLRTSLYYPEIQPLSEILPLHHTPFLLKRPGLLHARAIFLFLTALIFCFYHVSRQNEKIRFFSGAARRGEGKARSPPRIFAATAAARTEREIKRSPARRFC